MPALASVADASMPMPPPKATVAVGDEPLRLNEPAPLAPRLVVPETAMPKPLVDMPTRLPTPAPTLTLALLRLTALPVPLCAALTSRSPPFVPSVLLLRLTVPRPLASASPIKVTAWPCVTSELPEGRLMLLPASRLMLPALLPLPVDSAPLTVMAPAPTGLRIVTGSLKAVLRTSTAPLPVALPSVMLLKPLARNPSSVASRLSVPLALLPRPIEVLAVTGWMVRAPLPAMTAVLPAVLRSTEFALSVSAPV